MSTLFKGSALLTQDSVGHASTSSVSECTSHHVQQYLEGYLPPINTTCKVESVPFLTAE